MANWQLEKSNERKKTKKTVTFLKKSDLSYFK